MSKPDRHDYPEYFATYIDLVPDEGDINKILSLEIEHTINLLQGLSESEAEQSYAPGKWSVKELMGHLTDCERIFGFRALSIARNEQHELPGFDHNDYVREGHFNQRKLHDLAEEFRVLRLANIHMFRSFDALMLSRRGIANGLEFVAKAMPYIIAGHEIHHRKTIERHYLS